MAMETNTLFFNELREKDVSVVKAGDLDWEDYTTTYNEVRSAVAAAGRHGLQVQARSGGHSYTSFSHGGRDGAVVVDLRHLQNIDVRHDHRLGCLGTFQAKVGGGRLAIPHGTCPSVGVGGHFTHGGYGHASRAWGLAMDQIVAMDVVLANGNLVYTEAGINPDLFFAMRGAAESFGIVVNFHLRLHRAPDETIRWKYEFGDLIGDTGVQGAVSAMLELQKLVHDGSVVDRNLSFGVDLGERRFGISGAYMGSSDDFEAKIEPAILRCFPKEPNKGIVWEELAWLDNLRSQAGGEPLLQKSSYKGRSNFFAKSVTVPEPGLSAAALTSYFEHIATISAPSCLEPEEEEEQNQPGWFAIMDLYGGADSQINNTARLFPDSYPHRDSLWVAQHYVFADEDKPFPASGLELAEGLNEAMTRHMDGRCAAYINYTDSSLSREQAHALYYGDEVLDRLRTIKKRLDPRNVFAHPQSIV
ncbi:uncharacterized protein PG986_004401 [Apiospora aurea]|uniref:FAD-binding PCMH-type domain-containing protein n=1 Tax=Apiospora aurea TaxID=335848 RepID=A0ABR1QMY8_9PEZI